MANFSSSMTFSFSGTRPEEGITQQNYSMVEELSSSALLASNTELLGTSYEGIEVGGIFAPGRHVIVENTDDVDEVIISFDGGVTDHVQIEPGHYTILKPAGGTDVHIRSTGGVYVRYWLIG